MWIIGILAGILFAIIGFLCLLGGIWYSIATFLGISTEEEEGDKK